MNIEKEIRFNKKVRRFGPTILLLGILFYLLAGISPTSSLTLAGGNALFAAKPLLAAPAPGVALAPALDTIALDLCVREGNVTMPDGAAVDIWGFAVGDCSTAGPAEIPGPVIRAAEGDTVEVTLHVEGSFPENVSLYFPGQELTPDLVGAAPGGSVFYSFTANRPGTFLYGAGTNFGGALAEKQVPMGLYGALIVDPATSGQAYNDTDGSSAYDAEAILLLSELDPVFTSDPYAPDPLSEDLQSAGFDYKERNYNPTYWLINGQAYPDTDPISAAAGDRLLLRFLNAGSLQHTMTSLGSHQRLIARDAYLLNNSFEMVADTIPSGQTADTITEIPTSAGGTSFALYNRNLHITNGPLGPDHFVPGGGMMTFVEVIDPVHVGDLDGVNLVDSGLAWTPVVTITLHDVNEAPVSNATVMGTWSSSEPLLLTSGSCMTNAAGACTVVTVALSATSPATVTFTVDSVVHATLTYTPENNHDPDGDSDAMAISVPR